MQGDPPIDIEEMHKADVLGQPPQMSLSEGDADGDARDLKETQHRGCFGLDASLVEEKLARFARAASAFVGQEAGLEGRQRSCSVYSYSSGSQPFSG